MHSFEVRFAIVLNIEVNFKTDEATHQGGFIFYETIQSMLFGL